MAYIGKQPQIGNYIKLDAITTSATTTFNLTAGGVAVYPQTATNCIVSLNGVIQAPTDAYTISGSTIVFASALTTSDVIDFITVLGDVLNIGTPSDGTVGFSKVTSNLITGATAETSIAGADSILIYDDSASALRKMTRTNFVSGIGGTNTPAFFATMSADQTVTNATNTKIQFNTEAFDTDSNYSTTNYRFTPTTAGKYFVFASVDAAGAAITANYCSIYKNGTGVYNSHHDADSHAFTTQYASAIIDMNGSTDYLEIYTYIDTTGTPTVKYDFSSGKPSYFGAYKLIGV